MEVTAWPSVLDLSGGGAVGRQGQRRNTDLLTWPDDDAFQLFARPGTACRMEAVAEVVLQRESTHSSGDDRRQTANRTAHPVLACGQVGNDCTPILAYWQQRGAWAFPP